MSVRLYPEVFVTMEIILKVLRKKNKNAYITGEKPLYIDINDCITLQKDVNHSPHLHIFTSNPNSSKNWDEKDYKEYLQKVGYFSRINDTTIYKVNAQTLFNGLEEISWPSIKKCVSDKLLIDGAYNGLTMATLGME